MEKEISMTAKIGIVTIALAIVISLGFGAFMITKSTVNDGSVEVANALQTVEESELLGYNNRRLSGVQLISLLDTHVGNVEACFLVEVINDNYTFCERGYSICINNKYYTNWGRIIRPVDVEPTISEIGKYVTNLPNFFDLDGDEISGYFFTNASGSVYKVSTSYKVPNTAEYVDEDLDYNCIAIRDNAGQYIGLIFSIDRN